MDGFLILDQPRGGAENMAIDDAMLKWCDEHQAAALRIYQWSTPTLSLGYFQPWKECGEYVRHSDQKSAETDCGELEIVRRRTGGGAIVHHHDWTYSLAIPWETNRQGPTRNLYQWVHQGLVRWLANLGFQAHMQILSEPTAAPPFLCFLRRTEGDILVGSDKVIGSAQRRGRRSVLQHGSVLLARSPFASVLPGLHEIRSATHPRIPLQEKDSFGRSILTSLQESIAIQWQTCHHIEGLGLSEISAGISEHRSSDWLQRV
jgi:lipoate-protein ligase A